MTDLIPLPAPRRRRRPRRPVQLLTQNSELRADGVWNWTLPALAARLPDGRTIKTCPAAGVCAQACYARNGTCNIPTVAARQRAVTDAGWCCPEILFRWHSWSALGAFATPAGL